MRKEGSDRASKRFTTKEAAESWGRMQSIKDRSRLVIHRLDGTIARMDWHESDPHPRADRKK